MSRAAMGLSTTRLLSTAMMFTMTSAGGALSPTLPGSFSIRWLTTLVAVGKRHIWAGGQGQSHVWEQGMEQPADSAPSEDAASRTGLGCVWR